MKIMIKILLFLPLLGLASCVKQKNCDCEDNRTGYLVYLKEPYKRSENDKEKIVAYLSSNEIIVPIDEIESISGTLIKGYIPPSFRSVEPIRVNVCLKGDIGDRIHVLHAIPEIYSLKCIEKED
ncbi:MAG: hypothetical protein LBH82_03590, partial [Bacteroidales bacterium]|jgi:hypothetical protein|nr:hypothetical protein [Bacteroidales bacterium]